MAKNFEISFLNPVEAFLMGKNDLIEHQTAVVKELPERMSPMTAAREGFWVDRELNINPLASDAFYFIPPHQILAIRGYIYRDDRK